MDFRKVLLDVVAIAYEIDSPLEQSIVSHVGAQNGTNK
jgi:hypothetical protein